MPPADYPETPARSVTANEQLTAAHAHSVRRNHEVLLVGHSILQHLQGSSALPHKRHSCQSLCRGSSSVRLTYCVQTWSKRHSTNYVWLVGNREEETRAAVVAEDAAGNSGRVGCELGVAADVAPEAVQEYLEPSILKPWPRPSLRQP